MIAPVDGAVVMPMPLPCTISARAKNQYGLVELLVDMSAKLDAHDQQPGAHDLALTEAFDQLRRLRGRHHVGERPRQHAHAGTERAVAAHELHVLGDDEVGAEHREEHERDRGGRGGEARVAEEAQVEHRLLGVQLPHDEPGEDHEREREGDQASAWSPAVVGRFDDAVHERAQPDDRQQRTERVEGCVQMSHASAGIRNAPATSATITTNTLMRKIEPHQKFSSNAAADHAAHRDAEPGEPGPDRDGTRAFVRAGTRGRGSTAWRASRTRRRGPSLRAPR